MTLERTRHTSWDRRAGLAEIRDVYVNEDLAGAILGTHLAVPSATAAVRVRIDRFLSDDATI